MELPSSRPADWPLFKANYWR
ncbi:hypothetical protein Pint_19095 [Pistacia integerrima]|uniref:Uncharacterized protein n=1 Tax=Pistacia integerrima TaxID=434235 RepID=A0ACC0YZH8_9ROSI|nr:hypothetical protein Pint_19095 [Pistacia integerrima]